MAVRGPYANSELFLAMAWGLKNSLPEHMHKVKYHSLGILSHLACLIRTFRHFTKSWKVIISFIMSVCLSMWNNSAPTGLIFMKFDIWGFSKNLLRKFRFHSNRKRITGTLHQRDLCTFMVISPWILLRMRNVSDRSYRANHNTHFVFHKVFPKVIPLMR